MGTKDLYAVRTVPGTEDLCVYKADAKFNVSHSSYLLKKEGATYQCDCPAGYRSSSFCRHKQMLPEFRAEEAIDNPRKWYWFDQKKWVIDTASGGFDEEDP